MRREFWVSLAAALLSSSVAVAEDGFAWITAPGFDDAGSAMDGVVPLKDGEKWGLMGADGTWVVAPRFDQMGAANQGLFSAAVGGQWGVVDASGKDVVPFRYQAVGSPGRLTPVQDGGAWSMLDEAGGQFALAIDSLTGNEGFCVTGTLAGVSVIDWVGPGAATHVLGQSGVVALSAPSEGQVVAEVAGGGRLALDCAAPRVDLGAATAEAMRGLHEGMRAVKRGGLWGFEATYGSGGVNIDPQFAAVRDFSEGLAPVQGADGRWGYIDKTGAMVIAPAYDAAYGLSDGIAGVRLGDLRGFIDRRGTLVIAPAFEDYWRHDSGALPVKKDGQWGLIAPAGSAPQEKHGLPLAGILADLPPETDLRALPSTTHFYFAQDIASKFRIEVEPGGPRLMTVLTGDDGEPEGGEIALWDRTTRKLITKANLPQVTAATLIADGRVIAAGTRGGDIVLLDAATGKEWFRQGEHQGPVEDMAMAPGGATLASLGGGWLRLWSLPEGRLLVSVRAEESKLAFAEDGKSLWLGDRAGHLRQLDLAGKPLRAMPLYLPAVQEDPFLTGNNAGYDLGRERGTNPKIALSPAGVLVRLVTHVEYPQRDDGVWDPISTYRLQVTIPEGRRDLDLGELSDDILAITISDEGNRVAVGPHLFDLGPSGAKEVSDILPLITFSSPEGGTYVDWIDRLRFLPDGNLVGIWSQGGSIVEADPETGQAIGAYGVATSLSVGALAPDFRGTDLYTVDAGASISRWDLRRGERAERVSTGDAITSGLETLTWTDGREVFVLDGYSDDIGIALDPETGVLRTLPAGEANRIISGYGDLPGQPGLTEAVRVRGEKLRAWLQQEDYYDLPLLDGGRLAVGQHMTGTYRVYDVEGMQLLATFFEGEGEWLILTPEGFFSASPGGAALVSVTDGKRAWSVDQVFQVLYRPDLVAAKLAGDPEGKVAEAAGRLDLSAVFGSGPAPEVRFVAPAEGQRVSDQTVEAGIALQDAGGGIGRIEWRVNGVTAEVTQRGAVPLQGAAQASARLALAPGANVIEVVVYNAAGLVASPPVRLTVEREGAETERPALHVLAVGVNDYADGRLRLAFAAADARSFAEAMETAGRGLFRETGTTVLLDGQATETEIDRAFGQLAASVRPEDVFILFIAGHGKTVDGSYYFIPADFRLDGQDAVQRHGISQERWQEWLARIPARKSVMVFDTCESGSLTGTRGLEVALEQSAAIERLTRAVGRSILSASTDDSPALEGYQGHGVMTYALLEAMAGGDTDGNGTVEVTELAGYLDRRVPEISQAAFGFSQVPQMSIRGSDFALVRAGKAPEKAAVAETVSYPDTITHVVQGGAALFETPAGSSAGTVQGEGLVGVHLVATDGAFAQIARGGQLLGWIAEADLIPVK